MPRILVAGDDILEHPEGKIVLEARGYQVIERSELQAAMALFLDDPPDILLLAKGFDGVGDLAIIPVVKACLQKTNIPILLVVSEDDLAAGLDWDALPVDDFIRRPVSIEDLLIRVQLAEVRMQRVFDNNPLSRLPGNTSILKAIQRAIDDEEPMAVCYLDIDNFKPYNDHYGFSRGDEVILVVARVLVNVLDEMARTHSFAGHVGGDDFVFIVPEDVAEAVCQKALANFEEVRNAFIEAEDVKRGGFVEKNRQGAETHFGLLSVSIAVILTGHSRFQHFGEVAAAASQIKHKVKEMEGNNYLIDQRQGYSPS
ncbi:MAG: diguanylate cyclase [Deltaproteobacteria bacterium]|nr:diguanylate cyclase [Deltaproteobacteria bacterium]